MKTNKQEKRTAPATGTGTQDGETQAEKCKRCTNYGARMNVADCLAGFPPTMKFGPDGCPLFHPAT